MTQNEEHEVFVLSCLTQLLCIEHDRTSDCLSESEITSRLSIPITPTHVSNALKRLENKNFVVSCTSEDPNDPEWCVSPLLKGGNIYMLWHVVSHLETMAINSYLVKPVSNTDILKRTKKNICKKNLLPMVRTLGYFTCP